MTDSSFLDNPTPLALDWGTPLRIDRRSGELVVMRGSVWITRENDPEDYVVDAGGRVAIRRDDAVLVQPWRRGEPVRVAWRSSGESLSSVVAARVTASFAAVVAAAAGTLAIALRGAAHAVAAVGQRAAGLAAASTFLEGAPRLRLAVHRS